jgi:hypothetical protein
MENGVLRHVTTTLEKASSGTRTRPAAASCVRLTNPGNVGRASSLSET